MFYFIKRIYTSNLYSENKITGINFSGGAMYLKRLLLLVSILFIVNSIQAQQLEFMQPVGYQNPFIKSGQFIANLYFYAHQSETEQTNYTRHNDIKNVNFISYLGVTDYITVSTRIAIYPAQKVVWESEGSTLKTENDFHINPELILSYRPIQSLEIYGSFNYRQYTTTQGPYTTYTDFPIGIDPETGNIIYELREINVEGRDPIDTSIYFLRFGLTYSGKLW